jgi:hypothetical protein
VLSNRLAQLCHQRDTVERIHAANLHVPVAGRRVFELADFVVPGARGFAIRNSAGGHIAEAYV